MASTLDSTRTRGLFLAGDWVETGEWDEVRSPYSEKTGESLLGGVAAGAAA